MAKAAVSEAVIPGMFLEFKLCWLGTTLMGLGPWLAKY